jgi:O-antigen biosynthesis protein
MNCAKDSQKRKLPLDFVVMGYTMNDALLKKCGVKITGRYDDLHAAELLDSLDPHVVWLASTWPETYSYTLSIVQRMHYPITAFDLGAIAQRCRDRGDGFLLPLELAKKPSELNDTLISFACNSKIPEASC